MKNESQINTPNSHQSAYPFLIPDEQPRSEGLNGFGLTKREYFAGLAMQGIVAASDGWVGESDWAEVARRSVGQADALLAKLEESK